MCNYMCLYANEIQQVTQLLVGGVKGVVARTNDMHERALTHQGDNEYYSSIDGSYLARCADTEVDEANLAWLNEQLCQSFAMITQGTAFDLESAVARSRLETC